MRHAAIFSIILILTGCSFKDYGLVDNPYPKVQPMMPTSPVPIVHSPGSLYSSQQSIANMVSDSRAYRVNDIVIINISESTTATNSATTDLDKTHKNDIKVPNLFGLEKTHTQFFGAGSTDGTVLGLETGKEHAGKGSTQRSGLFTGSLAARVIQVMPNNYLIIQGYKNIQVNGENQKIVLSGLVNPLMISKDHSVNSNQISDLELRYGGQGVVNAQQNPGLFSRILDFIFPF